MEIKNLENELNSLAYHGRGIIIGKSADSKKAITAYFIMGRSENSRNRVFVEDGEGIRTQAFDESKMVDPHLIIYAPVRVLGNKTIVTNGDQTDTIYDGMAEGKTFEQSLRIRQYEPDGPNYTPRISGIMNIENGNYDMYLGEIKLDSSMDISQFFGDGAQGMGIDKTERVVTEYYKFRAGEITAQQYFEIFSEYYPFIPVCFRKGYAVFSGDINPQINNFPNNIYSGI